MTERAMHLCEQPGCDKPAVMYGALGSRTVAFCKACASNPDVQRLRSHELALRQLRDWLETPKIVKALVSTGTATGHGLKVMLSQLDNMDEATVLATTAVFCRDRRVRRVIAGHAAETLGISRDGAMKALLHLSQIGQ